MHRILLVICAIFTAPLTASAAEVETMLSLGISRCEQIDPREYESGLLLNPEGYRTYYRRSACLQRVAVEFRERPLCERVRRRFSLFSSGWGYSRRQCLTLVDQEVAEDEAELRALRDSYLVGPVRLEVVQVVPNGNGRDYDIIPRFESGFPHSYRLEFALVDGAGIEHPVHEHGGYLRGAGDNLRLYLPRQQLLRRFPAFSQGTTYTLRVRLILSISRGGVGGWVRQDTIDSVFPPAERTQEFTTAVTF